MVPLSPDSQVVLSGLHEIRDIAAISTESSHQSRVLRIAIQHLNVIWWCSLAIYIHIDEQDVDIGSIGLRYEVDTVCQFWVGIWVWRRGQSTTEIWEASSTCSEHLQGIVLNLKSFFICPVIRVESEMNFTICYNFLLSDFPKNFIRTSSTVGFAWSGWEQESHFHIVCPGEVSHLKDHLWSLDNQSIRGNRDSYWENSAGWHGQWVERWCRCSLHWLGSCLGRMVRWRCQLEKWMSPHILQALQSYISLVEPYLMIHI